MRLIVTKRNFPAVNTGAALNTRDEIPMDSYRERLIKYVPVEILALYIAAYGSTYVIMSSHPYFPLLARLLLIAGIAGTFLWIYIVEGVTDWIQLVLSTFGYVVWIFALGVVPVAELPWYNQIVSAIILPAYVFGIPLVEGIPERW